MRTLSVPAPMLSQTTTTAKDASATLRPTPPPAVTDRKWDKSDSKPKSKLLGLASSNPGTLAQYPVQTTWTEPAHVCLWDQCYLDTDLRIEVQRGSMQIVWMKFGEDGASIVETVYSLHAIDHALPGESRVLEIPAGTMFAARIGSLGCRFLLGERQRCSSE